MRVCVVQNVSFTGHLALSTYLRNLIDSLGRIEGVNVTALVSRGYPDGGNANHLEVLESRMNLYSLQGNLFFVFWSLFNLWRTGRKNRIDLIHCLYPSSSTIACVLYKWMFSWGTKIVYDIRSPWIEMSTKRGRISRLPKCLYRAAAYLLERVLIKHVDGVVFITNSLRETYAHMGMNISTQFILSPSGVDMEHFSSGRTGKLRRLLGASENDSIIGYVGGIGSIRQLDFVVDGFMNLDDLSSGRWILVFIGDGDDMENLKSIVDKKGLNDVHFLGHVPYEEVPGYMADFDVGICHLPRGRLFNTSFPMKVLEYLSCGVPVVVSDIPAHRELTEILDGVRIYDSTASSFARAAMAVKGRMSSRNENVSRFSWPRIAAKITKFYSMLLEE